MQPINYDHLESYIAAVNGQSSSETAKDFLHCMLSGPLSVRTTLSSPSEGELEAPVLKWRQCLVSPASSKAARNPHAIAPIFLGALDSKHAYRDDCLKVLVC